MCRDLPGKGDGQSAAHDRLLWAVNTFGEVLGEVSQRGPSQRTQHSVAQRGAARCSAPLRTC